MPGTRFTAAVALCAFAAVPVAGQPALGLPLECTLGTDCHIQQLVDRDPGPGAADFACGGLTYDGHRGTDFALPTLAALERDVPVIAAAPGTVLGLRDGMDDFLQGVPGAPDIEGRECGNGVLLDHGDGWVTQYCHLARGSIAVRRGDAVERGQRLGTVGLSGQTEFPHVHLAVRRGDTVIDPFDLDGQHSCGAQPDPADTLWIETPEYVPGGLIAAGYWPGIPEYANVKAGSAAATRLETDSPGIVLWGYAFGGRAGDVMEITILAPDGRIVIRTEAELERAQAQYYRARGLRRPDAGWPPGLYSGTVRLLRGGAEIDRLEATLTVE